MHGRNILEIEVTNISSHGLWILSNEKEFFLSYDNFPWFKDKTVNDIIAKKGSKKISIVTSYDYTMATLCDQVDILLVGDSAGMVMLGYENTVPVTMDEMVLFTKAVSNARENALIVENGIAL